MYTTASRSRTWRLLPAICLITAVASSGDLVVAAHSPPNWTEIVSALGHVACLGHGGDHTTWTCRTCDQTVYGPPLNNRLPHIGGSARIGALNIPAAALASNRFPFPPSKIPTGGGRLLSGAAKHA